jgi:LAO/AO transport system kinase
MTSLADRILARDLRALARGISLVENDDPRARDLIRAIYSQTGRAFVVGITGAPGAGKSTLVDRLTARLREGGASDAPRVGVIAIDPTSPFTGGAVLGDRVRMQAHAGDTGVFIRSMATRGHLGGLSRATRDAALLLDAAGHAVIIIETVGVGQGEIDIVTAADLSIVMLVPGTGDDVQALKAGIMEIADIFVVNKADRDGADALVAAVDANLSLQPAGPDDWRPPIIKTVATTGDGVDEVVSAIERFRYRPESARLERRRASSEGYLEQLIASRFLAHLRQHVLGKGELAALAERIASRAIDPYTAADELIGRALVVR